MYQWLALYQITPEISEMEFGKVELNALESMVRRGFICKPVTIAKSKPTSVFINSEVTKLIGLKVADAEFGKDLLDRMEFSSKKGVTPERLTALLGAPHKTDAASYELIYDGVKGFLPFNSTGIVKVSGQLTLRLIHFNDQDLANLV